MINTNLKVVSLVCNTFVIGMCLWLIYRLAQHIRNSKSNSQKRKIPLLNWSMVFILCFFFNTLLLVAVPFWPKMYAFTDLLQQVIMLISVLVYFKQWETNLALYVNNRFLLMLKVKSRSNRLTFMARIMNLASK